MPGSVCDQFQSAVELIVARWSGLILRALFEGHQSYSDIRSAVDVIQPVLTSLKMIPVLETAHIPSARPFLDEEAAFVPKSILETASGRML